MNSAVKSMTKAISQLNYILTKKQKRNSIWIFVTMIMSSALELLGISIIFPFLEIMTDAELSSKGYYIFLSEYISGLTREKLIVLFGITFAIIYIIKNSFLVYSTYVQSAYATSFKRETSTRMLSSYMRRPYEFFVNTNSAYVQRCVLNDVESVYQILIGIFTMLTESVTVIMISLYLVYTNWVVALGAMIIALVCFLWIVLGFKKRIKKAGKDARSAMALKNKHIRQAVGGIKEIFVANKREEFVYAYETAARIEEKAVLTNLFLSACPDRILEGICMSGFMLIICVVVVVGNNDAVELIPQLGTFAMGAFKILPSIAKISTRINSVVFYFPSLSSCYENFKETRMSDALFLQDESGEASYEKKENGTTLYNFNDEIRISGVQWKYKNSKKNVLNNVDFSIKKGQAIGLVGASGAGKTTLVDIILGLYKPQSGSVLMDNQDIFSIADEWANIISYVPQMVYLIDDSIRKNVAFGVPDQEINDERVRKSLEQAQLIEFVERLPNGIDTIVGEQGVKFSGGQRQRIAIARALYSEPQIVVLDEATSALDNDTELAVMEAINELHGKKTLIIVAHRLSTIKMCDEIFEIKDGVAVKRTPEELGII